MFSSVQCSLLCVSTEREPIKCFSISSGKEASENLRVNNASTLYGLHCAVAENYSIYWIIKYANNTKETVHPTEGIRTDHKSWLLASANSIFLRANVSIRVCATSFVRDGPSTTCQNHHVEGKIFCPHTILVVYETVIWGK